jgi:hypothetical protein
MQLLWGITGVPMAGLSSPYPLFMLVKLQGGQAFKNYCKYFRQ